MSDGKKVWVTEEWKDLGFTVRFKDTVWDNSPHGYEFEIYEVTGWSEDTKSKRFDVPTYERKGATQSGDDSINGLEDAQPYLTGFIKWDGCSHFYFGDQGYLHLCGLNEIDKLREILNRLMDRAKDKGVEY